ncbi:MAG: hypothetical protein ACKO1N_06055 [Erythrobacter sp.]
MTFETDSNNGQVTGTASVAVPMTLMQLFDKEDSNITVSCTADLNIPNTDVMMVLDTTLSMNDINPGDSIRRIDALNNAVLSFYDTLETARPAGSVIRYGFVPYSHTVNVGRLLRRDWIQNDGVYDSRVPDGVHNFNSGSGTHGSHRTTYTGWAYISGSIITRASYPAPSENCPASLPRENWTDTTTNSGWTPSSSAVPRSRTNTRVRNGREFTITRVNGNCTITPRDFVNHTERRTETYEVNPQAGQPTGGTPQTARHWFYRPVTYDLRALKGSGAGTDVITGGTFNAPVNDNQTDRTIRWPDGTAAPFNLACIEERATRRTNETVLTPRYDMDVDLVPNPSDPATQWKPYLPGVLYSRNVTFNDRESQTGISTNVHTNNRWIFSGLAQTSTRTMGLTTTYNFYNPTGGQTAFYESACPSPSRKLAPITRAELLTYMTALRPQGYTYHEIGLIWGLRLISREGLFAQEHDAADANGAARRHIIFMVDGQTDTRPFTYSAWGIAGTTRRRTPSDGFPSRTLEDAVTESRVAELCTLAKNSKNITVWVIAFGTDLTTLLSNCASPNRAFRAANAQQLTEAFASIATQLAELRLTN